MSSVTKQERGSTLKDLRLQTGLTRSDFANRYGFNHDRLVKLEQGIRQTLYPEEVGRYLKVCIEFQKDPIQYFPIDSPQT